MEILLSWDWKTFHNLLVQNILRQATWFKSSQKIDLNNLNNVENVENIHPYDNYIYSSCDSKLMVILEVKS